MLRNEIVLDKNNNFITKYGSTIDTEKPSVVYLRTKSKITPLINLKEYNNEVNCVKKEFEEFVTHSIRKSKCVQNDFLFNIDISEKSVRYGKVSFLRYDVYLKPIKNKTLLGNKFRIEQLSKKFDKKLEELLNQNNIVCR